MTAIITHQLDELESALIEAKETIGKQSKEIDRLTTESLESSLKYQELKKENGYLRMYLFHFLDDFEGHFDYNGKCDTDMAVHYLAAANHARQNYSRVHNRIKEVNDFLDKFRSGGSLSLFDLMAVKPE